MPGSRGSRYDTPRVAVGRIPTFQIDGLSVDQVRAALEAAEEDGNRDRVVDILAGLKMRVDRRLAAGKSISFKLNAMLYDARAAMHRMPIATPPAPPLAPRPAPPKPKAPHLEEYAQLLDRYTQLLRVIMLPTPTVAAQESARRARANLDALGKAFLDWERRYPPDLFPWPSTRSRGGGDSFDASLADQSPLGRLGYVVGKTAGRPENERRITLDWAYANHLPPVESPEYMAKWGAPLTAARLRQIAEHIARLGKWRRNAFGGRDRAVQEWQADLDYLHRRYYQPRFGDSWPTTR